jgi:hypothetical protein
MSRTAARPAHSLQLLLTLLVDPSRSSSLDASDWDSVVRWARSSRLLATLYARLAGLGLDEQLPERVRAAMASEAALARHRAQMARFEMVELARVLTPLDAPLVLLKGAAYLAQRLPLSEGRFLSDVDLLVPKSRLDEVERLLLEAGWQSEELDRYDEHYYRAWSHELPPMRFPGRSLELDLHHTILPITARVRPDAAALIETAMPLPGSAFRVLSPEDQVLHACAHLFQDSDLSHRLRDLADIDALLRQYTPHKSFWGQLRRQAVRHGLVRPCWYSLQFCKLFFGSPVPDEFMKELPGGKPLAPVLLLMDGLVGRALPPVNPDRPPALGTRAAGAALLVRSVWLRMPIWLLAYHSAMKFLRRLRDRMRPQGSTPK